jgi:hypothetical protein
MQITVSVISVLNLYIMPKNLLHQLCQNNTLQLRCLFKNSHSALIGYSTVHTVCGFKKGSNANFLSMSNRNCDIPIRNDLRWFFKAR